MCRTIIFMGLDLPALSLLFGNSNLARNHPIQAHHRQPRNNLPNRTCLAGCAHAPLQIRIFNRFSESSIQAELKQM